jgi:tetratricopeptide (TPR) repeat protein
VPGPIADNLSKRVHFFVESRMTMKKIIVPGRWVFLVAFCVGGTVLFAEPPAKAPSSAPIPAVEAPKKPALSADQLLGQRLGQMARLILSSGENASADPLAKTRLRMARGLLDRANTLDPANADLWRLRLEAGFDDPALVGNALRAYIKTSPRDDGAQLRLVSLLADGMQTADQRLAMFQRVLAGEQAKQLSPAMRSRIAFRAAMLFREQGDNAGMGRMLKQALALDETNRVAGAATVQLLQQHNASRADVAQAVLNLLSAAPTDAAVHARLALALLDCGQYTQAVTWYESALRIWSIQGYPSDADVIELYSQYVLAMWGSGRPGDALKFTDNLAAASKSMTPPPQFDLPTPLQSIVVAIHQGTGKSDLAKAAFDKLHAALQKSSDEKPDDANRIADLVWAHLLFNIDVPAVDPLMKRLAALLPADHAVLRRFAAWRLLRGGAADEARKALTDAAAKDPFCKLGLAYAEPSPTSKEAIEAWSAVYASQPGTLIGLIATQKIAAAGARAQPSDDCQAVGRLAQQVPADYQQAMASPLRFVMLRVNSVRERYAFGEPVEVDLELTNVSPIALSLGSNGTIPGTVVLSPIITDRSGQKHPVQPIVVDMGRRLRLESRESLVVRARLDVGPVDLLLSSHPLESYRISGTAVLNPRVARTGEIVPGLLGVTTTLHPIERTAWTPDPAAVASQLTSLNGADPAASMVSAALLITSALQLAADHVDLAQQMADAVNAAFPKMGPTQQAWAASFLLETPTSMKLFRTAADAGINSPDNLVREMTLIATVDQSDAPILTAALRGDNVVVRQFAEDFRSIIQQQEAKARAAKLGPPKTQSNPKPEGGTEPRPAAEAKPPASGGSGAQPTAK